MPLWRLGLAAVLVVLGFWLLSWNRVSTWLEQDASRRETQWIRGEGPWRWSLDRSGDIVWPGSRGLARAGSAGAAGQVTDGVAEFSLALRGTTIDLALVDSVVLLGEFSAPARVLVLGNTRDRTFVVAEAQVPAGEAPMQLVPAAIEPGVLDALRLRVETAPGSRIALRRFALLPPRDLVVGSCAAAATVQATLAQCPHPVAALRAPASLRPEPVLLWRDELLARRPGALVRTGDAATRATPLAAPQRLEGPLGTGIAIALVALPLLVAATSRMRRAPSPRRALVELALVLAPWFLLLWGGWPSDDDEASISLLLLSSIVAALALRSVATDWTWRGDARAWRASLWLVVFALPLLAATALANAWDGDGLVPRPFAAAKFWQYPPWAVLQQVLLMHAITPRLRLATRSDAAAALAAGAVFGLLHLPNLSLMLATFVVGTAWAWLGQKHRALLPLAASHVVLGLAWLWLAPTWLLRSAEIGGRFLMPP